MIIYNILLKYLIKKIIYNYWKKIKIFNNELNSIKNSKWIFIIKNKQIKKYNFILIFFEIKKEAEKTIGNRL